jgi:hypothetical protein
MDPSFGTTSSTGSPPPGWYTDPDPRSTHQQRWWDGIQWTDQVRPAPASTPVSGERVGAAKAVRALVFAIVGLLLFVPLSIAALVMGGRARGEAKRAGRPVDGRMTAAFVVGIIGLCWWGLVGIIAVAGGSSTTTHPQAATGSSSQTESTPVAPTPAATTTAAKPASTPAKAKRATSTAATQPPAVKKEPEMTSGQRNALESAHTYIDMSGFSKKGLIKQLSSSAGDGFSRADATFAANHVGADWKQEALESAQSYIDMSGFSKKGLIQQLSSSAGDGYSRAEATFAANNVGADWKEEAVESAQNYLDIAGFSEQALIEQLSSSAGDGYTSEQARYAVKKVY